MSAQLNLLRYDAWPFYLGSEVVMKQIRFLLVVIALASCAPDAARRAEAAPLGSEEASALISRTVFGVEAKHPALSDTTNVGRSLEVLRTRIDKVGAGTAPATSERLDILRQRVDSLGRTS